MNSLTVPEYLKRHPEAEGMVKCALGVYSLGGQAELVVAPSATPDVTFPGHRLLVHAVCGNRGVRVVNRFGDGGHAMDATTEDARFLGTHGVTVSSLKERGVWDRVLRRSHEMTFTLYTDRASGTVERWEHVVYLAHLFRNGPDIFQTARQVAGESRRVFSLDGGGATLGDWLGVTAEQVTPTRCEYCPLLQNGGHYRSRNKYHDYLRFGVNGSFVYVRENGHVWRTPMVLGKYGGVYPVPCKRDVTPCYFDGNLRFGELRTWEDVTSLQRHYAGDATDPLDAQLTFIPDGLLPKFTFKGGDGVTLREWLKVSNGS